MNLQEATAEAERSLLAGLILDPGCLDQVGCMVTRHDFEREVYGELYDHMADLHASGLPIHDVSVLIAELMKTNAFKTLGAAGFGRLRSEVATAAGVVYHAKEVLRFKQLRKLREAALAVLDGSEDPTAEPTELAAGLDAMAKLSDASQEVVSCSQMLESLADQMDRDREAGQSVGVATGIGRLDAMTGGMMGGELIILGARTSIGKTAFGMQMAMQAALDGRSVLVVSLEMGESQLAQRIAASQLGLSLLDLRTGAHTKHDSQRVRSLATQFAGIKLDSMLARRATMAQIRGIARAQKATAGLDLLMVDYLQLVAPRNDRAPRFEQVSEISGELKTIALELDVPVVALSQLNRQGEGEAPKLSHLRESGSLEQDADSVWFLHRPRDGEDTELIVEKQRQGKRFTVDLQFDGARCAFFEPSPPEVPEGCYLEFAEYAS